MSRGMPSMIALLGMLAVAGYQNRGKMAEILGGVRSGPGNSAGQKNADAGDGGFLGKLGGVLGGGGAGGLLSGGLKDLLDRFRQNGQAEAADSWVGKGPNLDLAPDQLEKAIGPDVMKTLSAETGLSREELLRRLTRELPTAVDQFTPDGRMPTEEEAARLIKA